MKPRHAHSATVFASGSNFRMVVMFGGMGWSGEVPLAETTLLHLGERQRKQIPPCYFLSVCLYTAYVLRQENSMCYLKYSCFNDSRKETLRVQVPAISCSKDSCSPCQFKHSLTQSWCWTRTCSALPTRGTGGKCYKPERSVQNIYTISCISVPRHTLVDTIKSVSVPFMVFKCTL